MNCRLMYMTVLKHVIGALCIISASYVHHVTGKPQSGYISNTSKLIQHILHEIFWNPKNTSNHTNWPSVVAVKVEKAEIHTTIVR